MKRILPAFAAAALIHMALLTVDTRWLIRRDTTLPRAQVVTMQLVDRTPDLQPSIQPLPTPPPSLPPVPEKPPVKPQPVVKKPLIAAKRPPAKKVRLSPHSAPTPTLPPREPESEPSPPVVIPETKPAAPHSSITNVKTLSPTSDRQADQIPGKKTATAPAVVKATPRYSDNPPPTYPSIARKRGYQGTAVLEVFVNADGRVSDLRIIESSRHKLLDRSAIKAVRRWRFEPGRQGDHTIAMWVRVPVQFILK